MIICPICGKESRDDYCIFCMRPIETKEAERYNAQKELSLQYIEKVSSEERSYDYDTIAEIPVKPRKPVTLKSIAKFLFFYNLIVFILGIIFFALDICVF